MGIHIANVIFTLSNRRRPVVMTHLVRRLFTSHCAGKILRSTR